MDRAPFRRCPNAPATQEVAVEPSVLTVPDVRPSEDAKVFIALKIASL